MKGNGVEPERVTWFQLGKIVATQGVIGVVPPQELAFALSRHACCDWGELSDDDRASNEEALSGGKRLFSAYDTSNGIRFWIITEHDRSRTTLLLPLEY